MKCPRCRARLKKKNKFKCLQCGFQVAQLEGMKAIYPCRACGSPFTEPLGLGEERRCTICGKTSN